LFDELVGIGAVEGAKAPEAVEERARDRQARTRRDAADDEGDALGVGELAPSVKEEALTRALERRDVAKTAFHTLRGVAWSGQA
jgi:hypothetical protein